jgi:arylsulfatase A-like enzyme
LAISGIVPVGDAGKSDYDPNLGGRGDEISIESLNLFTDNLFDVSRVDDSIAMQDQYNADHFLSVLVGQRDKHVYDLSAFLKSYITDYGENSSIVKNQRQQIISEIANHNHKINRRKKQIEIAVKAPMLYGTSDTPIPSHELGEIPINDFSYLQDLNIVVDLEKQKALIFEVGEVTGMVLPITPTFVKSPAKPPSIGFDHLNVPPVGKGSIIYSTSASPSGTVLSLDDRIVTDNLFAIYNFLETKVVTPSSGDYFVTNCATTNQYNNAKLVGTQNKKIFRHGLSVPYLEGITLPNLNNPSAASGLGSFVRLPDTSEFRELTYNPKGFSIEFWSYVPNITKDWAGWDSDGVSSLTKVVLGCENVGNKVGASALNFSGGSPDLDYLPNDRGDQFVRGMLMGFTRDRRITQASAGYSNDNELNNPTSSLSFFIAPTISKDSSSCSWINDSNCETAASFHKMKVDLSSSPIGNVSSHYVLVDITADPKKDEVKFYADGSLLATSALSKVFGVNVNTTPSLPSFKVNNSFEYSSSSVDGPNTLHQGPKLNTFYTPWIVGGGYTDGLSCCGNFMGGGDRGGRKSGYNGFLGSLKFYSKPLTGGEVARNYASQEGYFKNIDTKLHQFNYDNGQGFNIVLVLMDDIGIDKLGLYDSINPYHLSSGDGTSVSSPFSTLSHPSTGTNLYPHTPTLSAIAAGGLTFMNARVQTQCTPTRAAIMTGKRAYSSPNYKFSDSVSGYWGHGLGTVATQNFNKSRGGLNGLGMSHSIYDKDGNYLPLSQIVQSADGRDSIWDAENNFVILPKLLRDRQYRSAMAGKWHLADWNEMATYAEDDGGLKTVSGAGWSHIPNVGAWDNYRATFFNLNKSPIPGHNNHTPHSGSGPGDNWFNYGSDPYPILDDNMGQINYFMNIDGEVLTVSDTNYTCFTSSIDRPDPGEFYLQGDASSFSTNKIIAEASALYNALEEPFFLYVPLNAAHSPFTLPPSGTIYNWDNFYSTNHIQARLQSSQQITAGQADASAAWVNENACIENVDYMLSSFLSSISPERKNRTLFLFMGDNGSTQATLESANYYISALMGFAGDTSGVGPDYNKMFTPESTTPGRYLTYRKGGVGDASGRGFKGSVYERGSLVPLLASASFITNNSDISGTTTSAMVEAVDIYATIADIAGISKTEVPLTPSKPQRFEGDKATLPQQVPQELEQGM